MAYQGKSKSSRYYAKNPKALAKKKASDRAYRKRTTGSGAPDNARKRAANKASGERWAERKRRGIAGKGGPDVSHRADGKLVLENRTKNRSRNGKNGKSTKKPTKRK